MAEDVTVVREPKKDTFGNRPAGEVGRFVVQGWDFAPGPTREPVSGAGIVESDGTLYGPPVTVIAAAVPQGIKPTDKIEVRGDPYQVIGRVQDWGADGTVILLKRVTG